jgi:hypothetical protein
MIHALRTLLTRSIVLVALGPLACSRGTGDDAAPSARSDAKAVLGDDPGLVVHEWGTFTSMAGSDGASLDGLHHAADPLPAFVHAPANAKAELSPFHVFGDDSWYRSARHVDGKMETPVVYFYSKKPQRVTLHVAFEHGLLTEWYPRAAADFPAITPVAGVAAPAGPFDAERIARSSLEWDVDLTPFEAGAPAGMPAVAATDSWQFAREVHAAYVTPHGSSEAEHYLFYRGLGRVALPLQLRFCRSELEARSTAQTPIPAAFALEMGPTTGRFQALGAIDAGGQASVSLPAAAPRAEVVKHLGEAMEGALVAQGLFADEARAMVRTWAPTWFASEGTRVLYILPRASTDAILPLWITPPPSQTIRVLVGRQEILTAAEETAVDLALHDRAAADPAKRDDAMKRLARLGRFLEPAVRRAVASTADAAVKKSGAEILASFH